MVAKRTWPEAKHLSLYLVLGVQPQRRFLGGGLGFGFGRFFVVVGLGEAHAYGLADAEFLHGDVVHHIGAGHGALGGGDDDELGVVDEVIEDFDEAVDVGFVEGGRILLCGFR